VVNEINTFFLNRHSKRLLTPIVDRNNRIFETFFTNHPTIQHKKATVFGKSQIVIAKGLINE
jgi:hypothetical protein